jgi:hypothetical protein
MAGMIVSAASSVAYPAAKPENPPQAVDRLKAIADGYVEVVEGWSCTREDVIRLSTLAVDLVGLIDAAPQLCLGMGSHLPLGSPSMRHAFFAAIVGIQIGRGIGVDASHQVAVAKGAMIMNLASFELQDDLALPLASPSPAQRITLSRHPQLTADLLLDSPGADLRWIAAVEQHHESLDGSGYPNALHGNEICLEARILKLADVWCALVAPRRHRDPKTPRESIHWLLSRSRQCVDPLLFDALRRLSGHYPPGTLVRLANRETAIVVDPPRGTAAPRQVVSFLGGHRMLYRDPVRRDTGRSMYAIRGYASLPPIEIKPAYWNRIWEMSGATR